MIQGVDYSVWRPPSPAWLKQNGYQFVCRYLDWNSPRNPKVITKDEFDSLRAAGLAVVLVWEDTADRMKGGDSAGAIDAIEAKRQALALGALNSVIYFACDFDATPGDQAAINAYLEAAKRVLGAGKVGIYGGFWPVARAMGQAHADYGWQTYAWSGGQWYPGAQLRQVQNGILNGQADLDQAMSGDYGAIGGTMPPVQVGWQEIDAGNLSNDPPSLAQLGNQLFVFVRSKNDSCLWVKRWNGENWSGFQKVSNGQIAGPPSAIAWAGGILVMATGMDGHLYQYHYQA